MATCSCWLGRPGATFGSSLEREACAVHGLAPSAPGPHTPGPWSFEDCRFAQSDPESTVPGGCDFWIIGGPGVEVLAVTNSVLVGTQEGNARVMAAAPDLLASVRDFLSLYEGVTDMVGDSVRAKLARARAAVEKAEGR